MSQQTDHSTANLSRRNLLQGAVAATVVAASGTTFAGKHVHAAPQHNDLVSAALSCVEKGNICMNHCLQLFKVGDNSVAECAASVNEMLSMCNTLINLAASNSKHLAAFAQVCSTVCKDCEKECRKHEKHHAECKACAESCAHCIAECDKITA
jgi:Cys-rich four helix bundle protein (predicted Tat secretion target)